MNGKVGLSKGRGFTLLELLVTLSIAAILLVVGLSRVSAIAIWH
ncbi:MAG: type II secretion system protein [Porticoccaceae bacterium]|jgi:prepilin-type N-terminal cleavage/methylation domain-containing protein|nr:type II secretion system protein [Porticoccaceae bacterium]